MYISPFAQTDVDLVIGHGKHLYLKFHPLMHLTTWPICYTWLSLLVVFKIGILCSTSSPILPHSLPLKFYMNNFKLH